MIVVEDADSAATAQARASTIVEAIREPFELVGGTRQVSASIGVAWVPGGALSAADTMHLADQALYEAKAAGRDTACLAQHPSPGAS